MNFNLKKNNSVFIALGLALALSGSSRAMQFDQATQKTLTSASTSLAILASPKPLYGLIGTAGGVTSTIGIYKGIRQAINGTDDHGKEITNARKKGLCLTGISIAGLAASILWIRHIYTSK